jgi:hypothetical protein
MRPLTCPQCGAEHPTGAATCASCGGRLGAPKLDRLLADASRGGDEPEAVEPRGALGALLRLLNLVPGLAQPKVLILTLLALPVAGAVTWLGFFIAALGGPIAGVMIGGFGLVIYWTAVSWVVYGWICLPSEALAEFNSAQWTVFAVLALAPIAVGLALFQAHGGG